MMSYASRGHNELVTLIKLEGQQSPIDLEPQI